MEEEKQDVTPESSTGTEEAVTQESAPEQVAEPQAQAEGTEASTQEVKPEVKDNRPIENVAWESKRKVDELYSVVNEMKQMMQQGYGQQPQQPTYSKAQLMAYASDPNTTTEQRLWAYTEVDKLEKTEREKEYERLVKTTQVKTEAENKRSQSANWVASNFPETVVKDSTGQVLGWNQSSPVLMRANEYMSRSENLRNDPEGFVAAVKMAAFDLGVSMNQQINKKLDRTVGQLRKEQKKQLASAGGTQITESPEKAKITRYEKLKAEYARTGNKDVFAEMVKAKGLNPFV